jgi:hypothetical protein
MARAVVGRPDPYYGEEVVAGADGFDAQTFESWLVGATASEPARAVFRLIAQTIFCVEPGQLSPLTVLTTPLRTGGSGT